MANVNQILIGITGFSDDERNFGVECTILV